MGFPSLYLMILLVGLSSSKPALKFKFSVDQNTTQYVILGKRAYIDCSTDDERAKVSLWKLTGSKRVSVVSGSNVIVNKGDFFIKSTFYEDAGKYECRAVDLLGNEITRRAEIRIDEKKIALAISPPVSHKTVVAGSSFTLTCESTDIGNDALQWNFKHMRQRPVLGQNYRIKDYKVGSNGKKSVLTMFNGNSQFSGTYECLRKRPRSHRFKNLYFGDSIYVHIVVPSRPIFKNPMHTVISLKERETAILPCKASGSPTPTISWKKDGKPLKTCSPMFTHYCNIPFLKTDGGLQILSTTFARDNGSYTCQATNVRGAVEKTFDVMVLGPPNLSSSPVQITRYDRQPYDIDCIDSRGNPPSKFSWKMRLADYGGYRTPWFPVKTGSLHRIYSKDQHSSTVSVPGVITYAQYVCTAENPFGKVSHQITILRVKKRN